MFSLFVVVFIISFANKYAHKEGDNLNALKGVAIGNNVLQNYIPLIFHLSITTLIIFSFLNPSILGDEKINLLIADGIFQFSSTMLIAIIAIINPFGSFTETLKLRLQEKQELPNNEILNWIMQGKNWQLIKIVCCVAIIIYFLKSGLLNIPRLDQGIISGICIFLIIIFIVTNIIQLIKNSTVFKKQVLYRLNYLFKSIRKSFFISVGVILTLFIISAFLGIDLEKIVKLEAIALLVYNIVMTYNEYKILNLMMFPQRINGDK